MDFIEIIKKAFKVILALISLNRADVDKVAGEYVNTFPCSEAFYAARARKFVDHVWDCSNSSLFYYDRLIWEGYKARLLVLDPPDAPYNYLHVIVEVDFGGDIGKRYYDVTTGKYGMKDYSRIGSFVGYEDLQTIQCSWEYRNDKSNPICDGYEEQTRFNYDVEVIK